MDKPTLTNFKDFIPKVFKKNNIGDKHSMRIDLDPPPGIQNPAEFLAKFLTDLFIGGLKHLYGNENGQIDLASMTNNQFMHMKKCIQTIGFDIHLEIYPQNIKTTKLYNIGSNDPTKLDYWILTVNVNDMCYSIWFTELPLA